MRKHLIHKLNIQTYIILTFLFIISFILCFTFKINIFFILSMFLLNIVCIYYFHNRQKKHPLSDFYYKKAVYDLLKSILVIFLIISMLLIFANITYDFSIFNLIKFIPLFIPYIAFVIIRVRFYKVYYLYNIPKLEYTSSHSNDILDTLLTTIFFLSVTLFIIFMIPYIFGFRSF